MTVIAKAKLQRITAALIWILMSCNTATKSNTGVVMSEEKMQAVMWDMFQADAFEENFLRNDSTKKSKIELAALQKKILDIHQVQKEDFEKSYAYYSARPHEMKVILDSIVAKAEREKGKVFMERYSGKPNIKPASAN